MPNLRVEMFRQALAQDPANELAHFSLANELMEEGEYQEALSHFRSALAASPDWMRVHIQVGRCLLELGQAEQARHSLVKAKELMEKLRDYDSAGEIEELMDRLDEGTLS